MKQDIETRNDIMKFVDSFYSKILNDKDIGFIFNDVAQLNMNEHMSKMYDFWETTIFHNNVYKGNPMVVHLDLNKNIPLTKLHFETWLALFNATVDDLFSGENAELAKSRALSIATVMQIKISQARQ